MIGLVKLRLQTTPYEAAGNNPTIGIWINLSKEEFEILAHISFASYNILIS